jgi:hypothetical protein
LRKFAVTLHFYSPKAYRYVRRKFNNCLPHEKTLVSWYSSVDGSPRFTKEALQILTLKAQAERDKGKEIICSLVFDETAIR